MSDKADNKTFYIIDGHAQIFRAYFAPFRELTSPTGEPTKATFVFTQMLLNLIDLRKPEYLAVVIDVGGDQDVFRRDIYTDYKANRQPKPPDFPVQEARILQIIRDSGVPLFFRAGFEADDVIATLAHQLCDKGFDTFIVSKDKDLRQLLSDCVHMYDPQSGDVMDVARLAAEYGYTPAQAVEIQTLTGDAIDNVPGIPGVGEKTAAKLVGKYGSAAAVLDHLDELTPKLRENLQAFGHLMPVTRQLVTLRKDVEIDFEPEKCRFRGLNTAALRAHLESLGFNGLLRRLDTGAGHSSQREVPQNAAPAAGAWGNAAGQGGLFDVPGGAAAASGAGATAVLSPRMANAPQAGEALPEIANRPPASTCADCTYTLVDTEAKFEAFLAEFNQQNRFAFDTETDALGAMSSNMIGASFSWKHGTGFYIPVRGPLGAEFLSQQRVVDAIRPAMENPAVRKVGHNLKYDILVMGQAGITVRGIELDSMIAAFLIDAGKLQYNIDRIALEVLNFRKIPTEQVIGKGKNQTSMDRVPLADVATYAAEDADIALRLADHFAARLKGLPTIARLCTDLETPLVEVLVEMERNGIAIDPQMLREQSEVLGQRAAELRKRILASACCEFNPDSPKQLAEVLFTNLKLPVIKRNKTGPSTDVEVLERLADQHECPRLILEYRSLVKLKNTYLDNLTEYLNPKTGRIHASFNQIGASTGRLSCSDPNLQNIPIRTDEGRRIRMAFVPGDREKNVLLTADYSQIELRILAHFTREPALMRAFENDEDVHAAVAAEVFGAALDKVTKEQRAQAKIINFGIIYGVSAHGLARRIDGLSFSGAQDLIKSYNRRFPSIEKFLGKCVMDAQSLGYVETIMGRRRPILDINSGVVNIRNQAQRVAINSVVQGSAADLIKVAMLNVHRRLLREKRPSRMLLQVHDELVFETPIAAAEADAALIREEMVNAMTLATPLQVSIAWGKNWEEGK